MVPEVCPLSVTAGVPASLWLGRTRDSGFYLNRFDSVDDMEGRNENRKLAPPVLDFCCVVPAFCPCSAVMLSEGTCWSCRAPGCCRLPGGRAAR